MVEPIMLITTHEPQHGKDPSPYLQGNADFFDISVLKVLVFCLFGAGKILAFISSSSKLLLYIMY